MWLCRDEVNFLSAPLCITNHDMSAPTGVLDESTVIYESVKINVMRNVPYNLILIKQISPSIHSQRN